MEDMGGQCNSWIIMAMFVVRVIADKLSSLTSLKLCSSFGRIKAYGHTTLCYFESGRRSFFELQICRGSQLIVLSFPACGYVSGFYSKDHPYLGFYVSFVLNAYSVVMLANVHIIRNYKH